MAEVGASSECQSGRMYRATQRERAEKDQWRPAAQAASIKNNGLADVERKFYRRHR